MNGLATTSRLPDVRRDGAVAAAIAAALLVLAAVAAGAAAVGGRGSVREWLGFGFGGIDPRVSEAAAILANNLRVLAAILIACGAVQLARRPSPRSLSARAVVALCDGGLAATACVHAVIVGLGVGAYGGRMVVALAPHGPIELAAYSLALALYVAARRERVSLRRGLFVAVASALGVAIAAPLEVFVSR